MGYSIPFIQKPPLVPFSRKLTRRFATKPSESMSSEIKAMIKSKIIVKSEQSSGFLSIMFLTPKQNGKYRQIFNLRRLNKYLRPKRFRLANHSTVTRFLQRGDFLGKIDLSQAYFHIPIKKSHQRFLAFCYEGKVYQMTCLPFGLSSAPLAFSRITNWIAGRLRELGIRTLVYLDDFLFAHQDSETLSKQLKVAMTFLQSLGWEINREKAILSPVTGLEFLGIIWNVQKNLLVLPESKKKFEL